MCIRDSLYGGYDFCVIQQFGHPIPPIEETEPPLKKLIDLCSHVGTKPVLYMTWAKKDEPENAELISRIYRTLAEKYRTPLAPIAEIYDSLRVDHPEIELYWFDGSHASPYGDYQMCIRDRQYVPAESCDPETDRRGYDTRM